MRCAPIQDRLFEYVDGSLDAATRERVASHLESCTECAALATSLERADTPDEDLTRAVLSRTTRDACEQSAERIPGWIDGSVAALDADLVAGHVAHCTDCAALANVMRTMAVDLPSLAEAEPDAHFVDDVMAATAYKTPALSWGARIEEWVVGLMQRPRIAWEGAYVATVFLVLLMGFPGSPLATVSQKALELAQTDPHKIEQPFIEFEAGLNTAANEAWFSTRKVARTIAVKASVGSGDVYRKAKRDLGTLWASIASDPVNDPTETQEEISTNGESK